ncbi:MAG: TrmB family transcriptional regulator [Deltaproteobacteria bacterium]|jgi:sugar-specific transcriptional regulator TrmB|nr:TrmB family transcriptional regulator [Deltaproteobacteria bacterium]MBW2530073.1 TrmB family transcriptional regulator [Deltaproteobacteria bacterium]
MSSPDVVQALVALGFNLNEGRAYGALLQHGPSTGYEVSQRTEVPRSAVYGALRRLVAAGAARSIPGNPERFVATPADALLAVLRKRFESSTDALHEAIRELEATPTVPDAYSVRGYDRVMEEAARLVQAAEATLIVSGWPRELGRLATELRAAHKRRVYTVLFSHAKLPATLAGIHFSYGVRDEQALEAFWKHRIVMVADDRLCLVGSAEQVATDTAVVSEAPAIADLASGQIALDITLLAQRHDHDVTEVMARLLGERIGRLDTLLANEPGPVLGELHRGKG